MAQSLIDVIEESLDPRSVTNALYELMVDWRACVLQSLIAGNRTNKKAWNRKRRWIETTLGRFMNKDPHQMRELLEQHHKIKVTGR